MSDEPSGSAFTLDGRPVDDNSSLPANWGQPERREGRIGDWGSSSPARREKKKDGAESYIGGEKSGLAVQNPDDPRPGNGSGGDGGGDNTLVSDILRQAADNAQSEDQPSGMHQWGNVGHTLGSDVVESERIGEPSEQTGEPQRRTLTFWADGFSIEDGPLHRFDAPGSRELLQAIQAGRAPMSLFEVRYDQPLHIVVDRRTNENWSQQPRTFRSFDGIGNRLGSVTPSFSGASSPARSAASPVQGEAARDEPPQIQLDESKPATNVQIRLGDGSRIVARVNLNHTVADLRNYIDATRPNHRQYILQTTFPPRELPDAETIVEAKLQNAVVIQRFK